MDKHDDNNLEPGSGEGVSRRQFLAASSLMVAGLGLTAGGRRAEEAAAENGEEAPLEPQAALPMRKLGRTGIKITTIVMGGASAEVHWRALDLGINYWHKMGNWGAPQVFANLDRDRFVCDIVIDSLDKEPSIAQFEQGLQRSGLEMIDLFKIHSQYGKPEDVRTRTGVIEAFEQLRDQGKTRFLAVSQHSNIVPVLAECLATGWFAAFQPSYSPASGPEFQQLIAQAHTQGVGVIAMKTLLGGPDKAQSNAPAMARLQEHLSEGTTVVQACLKYVLSTPGMTAAVPAISNLQMLEEDVAAANQVPNPPEEQPEDEEQVALRRFAREIGACAMCGICQQHCPQGLPIADILRYRMYYEGYGEQRSARRLYAKLSPERTVAACLNCGTCEQVCPNGIRVAEHLQQAHRLLA